MSKSLAILVLCVASAIMVRILFPIRITTNIPTITTVYDTVDRIDTAWRTRTIERVVREVVAGPNLVETVTVSRADTITLYQEAICPQLLEVGKVKHSTIVEGFTLQQDSADNILKRDFRNVFYTTGPLRFMAVDSTLPIRLQFSEPPKTCGFLCKLTLISASAAGGYVVCKL